MIGYGLAFVIGYLATTLARVCRGHQVYPWSIGGIVWGCVYMGLNWIAGLGG